MAGQSGLPSKLKYLFMTKIDRKFRNQVSFYFPRDLELTEHWGSSDEGSPEAGSGPQTRKST